MTLSGPLGPYWMSNFFVDSASDYSEQSDVEDIVQEVEEQPTSKTQKNKFSSFFDNDYKDDSKRVVKSEKSKRWADLRSSLNKVLDAFAVEDFKAGFEAYKDLVKMYNKAEKVIKEHGHPNFFVSSMSEIVSTVSNLVSTQKELRRFNAELETFKKPFDELLEEYRKDPEAFPDIEEEDEEVEEGSEDEFAVVESESEDDGPGKWFISSSSDDEDDTKTKSKSHTSRPKPVRRSQMTAAEAAEARLRAQKELSIDDSVVKADLDKALEGRLRGKITVTVERLSQLLEAVYDEDLERRVQLELCYSVLNGPRDHPIPVDHWELIIDNINDIIDHAPELVSLIERLDRDFWARSVDPRHLFTEEVSRLHQMLPSYIEILKTFGDHLEKNNDISGTVRVRRILLEHLHHQPQEDVHDISLSVIKLSSNSDVFDEEISLDYQILAALYYAINLSVRGEPEAAQKIVDSLPSIPPKFQVTQILFNRTLAEVGKAAFIKGNYQLSYRFLGCFKTESEKDKLRNREKNAATNARLGQNPSVYPPWLIIQPTEHEAMYYISAMIVDLAFYSSPRVNDEDSPIDFYDHKALQSSQDNRYVGSILETVGPVMLMIKQGDWRSALQLLSNIIKLADKHIENIKIITACCYIVSSSRYYDTVSVESLAQLFDITHEHMLSIIKKLISGTFPVTETKIIIEAELVNNEEYLAFKHVDVPSPLLGFGATIAAKQKSLAAQMSS